MKPIYTPSGKAKEYGDYAINIYTGCPHECFYCFAPSVLRRDKESFHNDIKPRDGVVEAVKRQIEKEHITDKLIHLCFTCDPYPKGYDSTATREIIKLLKDSGNHVQILTKNGTDAKRDFDLLDGKDWFGVTLTGPESVAEKAERSADCVTNRLFALWDAHDIDIKTWISFEPVLDAEYVESMIRVLTSYTDKIKIGKLNYHPSDINWRDFGIECERLCKETGIDYYIKDSLRKEMEIQ